MATKKDNAPVLTDEQQAIKTKFIETLGKNVNEHTDERNGLTYLSWAWAWAEFKKIYPDATYNIVKDPNTNLPFFADPRLGIIVYTNVTAGGITYEMWLPVMDSKNDAMKFESYSYDSWNAKLRKMVTKQVAAATMFDINKTIMRCLVKNLAMFGLGLYIYAKEDLPEEMDEDGNPIEKPATPAAPVRAQAAPQARPIAAPANDKISALVVEQRGMPFDADFLATIRTITDLLVYYQDHAEEIKTDPSRVALFTQAKARIQSQPAA